MVGCLLTEEHLLPPASVSISAHVVSVAKVPAAEQPSCGFALVGTDATRFTLQDAQGKSWELLFPGELVAAERFPAETELDVAYQNTSVSILAREHLLTVTEQGKLALFMIHGSRTAAVPGLELDWRYSGSCPAISVGGAGCYLAQTHLLAELGGDEVMNPCRSKVGEFSISNSLLEAGSPPTGCAGSGFCDLASQFSAFGVRSE